MVSGYNLTAAKSLNFGYLQLQVRYESARRVMLHLSPFRFRHSPWAYALAVLLITPNSSSLIALILSNTLLILGVQQLIFLSFWPKFQLSEKR